VGIEYLYVVQDRDGETMLVDTVEYDSGQDTSQAVANVMADLNMDEAQARKLIAKSNPGRELTSEQAARKLADQIASRSVPDRDPDTYGDPDLPLRVTEDKPLVPMAMVNRNPSRSAQ
jgi:hypothetical protein